MGEKHVVLPAKSVWYFGLILLVVKIIGAFKVDYNKRKELYWIKPNVVGVGKATTKKPFS